jgi:capsular polysaccharide biosynthesis protein
MFCACLSTFGRIGIRAWCMRVTAQAAFKYRYTVVTPARLPKSPTVPNVPLVTLVALIAAMLCGLLLAVVADVRRGRLLERWQIERLLERPILGEIALPDEAEGA